MNFPYMDFPYTKEISDHMARVLIVGDTTSLRLQSILRGSYFELGRNNAGQGPHEENKLATGLRRVRTTESGETLF